MRTATVSRKTRETDINLTLNLDGTGKNSIETGIGFFDHMLTALAVHSGMDFSLSAVGDLFVDSHHTVEDTGIVIGKAFAEAVGQKIGIARYGSAYIPMDEALGFCAVDISGRPFLVFNAEFSDDRIGDFDTCLAEEFFRAFAFNAGITMHINLLYGKNDHHKCEAIFKAAAHALKQAATLRNGDVLSTKGVL
ncbi:MAG TPA: imidazoleglycerol-phosphate dehydratase HisB [Oscillospiraceae bacterium]|jgi:imidazoleglycerol-phosphate dehydratase|nr:imidazoleglycerol-phosphate dehydratase HisB [Oscillospiraceae bacterium]